ncbi:TauD/TfdA family dioxygenase, partial [Frankia sp. AgW1.1]|nr:TauD/TfdA family dioxygenase [Frankia sp. AgW1.1]
MSVTVSPISAEVGVAITGLAGSQLADPAVAADTRRYLDEHGVVIYREAHIGDADLVALSRLLGEVVVAP